MLGIMRDKEEAFFTLQPCPAFTRSSPVTHQTWPCEIEMMCHYQVILPGALMAVHLKKNHKKTRLYLFYKYRLLASCDNDIIAVSVMKWSVGE